MNKKISVSVALALALLAMTVTFTATMVIAMRIFGKNVNAVNTKENQYARFAELDDAVRAGYLGEINDQSVLDTSRAGFVAGLGDKDTVFYTAKQLAEILDMQNGKLIGIGADFVKDSNGYFRITKIYNDSPAHVAGMEVEGYITAINGTTAKGMSLDAALSAVSGEAGTVVTLTYVQGSVEKSIELMRKTYAIPAIEYDIRENIGYIRILRFDNNTPPEFDYAIHQLQGKKVGAVVIDVRDNGGGVLESAAKVVDILSPAGVIVSAEYKNGDVKALYTSARSDIPIPIILITNQNTASSAELFALALRDFGNTKIVGTKTYGKGTMQELKRFTDGSGLMLTVARMVAPKSGVFDKIGIVPDFESSLTAEQEAIKYTFTIDSDPQITRAFDVAREIIKGNVTVGGTSSSAAPSSSSETPASEAKKDKNGSDSASADSADTSSAS